LSNRKFHIFRFDDQNGALFRKYRQARGRENAALSPPEVVKMLTEKVAQCLILDYFSRFLVDQKRYESE